MTTSSLTLYDKVIATRDTIRSRLDGRSPVLADLLRRGAEITPIEVSQAAQIGDPAAAAILSKSGYLIGQVVATLANALNPEMIVLSGTLVQTNDNLLAGIREAVYGASHPLVTRDLRIIRSQMGSSSGLVAKSPSLGDWRLARQCTSRRSCGLARIWPRAVRAQLARAGLPVMAQFSLRTTTRRSPICSIAISQRASCSCSLPSSCPRGGAEETSALRVTSRSQLVLSTSPR